MSELQKIPIDIEAYITKKMAGKNYQSKSELTHAIYSQMIEILSIGIVLADSHYATKCLLSILYDAAQQFFMRFTCSQIVKIGKAKGQLRKILRLRRNEHVRMIQGVFDEKSLYFYVVRLKTGCIAYFASLFPIDKANLEDLYKIRWSIEMFHRTAKQSLGWCDCQMRSIERQRLHSFYVMYSYIIAELLRVKLKLKTTEVVKKELFIVPNKRNLSLCSNRFLLYVYLFFDYIKALFVIYQQGGRLCPTQLNGF
jgi:hypothetical protein